MKDLADFRPRELAALLANWPTGQVQFTRPGTRSWGQVIAVTTRGQFLLQVRDPQLDDPNGLLFDHAVIAHLAKAGLPVVKALKTIGGSRWLQGESFYELFPLPEGQPFTPGDAAQVEAVGAMLAELHVAGESFKPPCERSARQRPYLPEAALRALLYSQEAVVAAKEAPAAVREHALAALELFDAVCRSALLKLSEGQFSALPQTIIHGKWQPVNLRFEAGRVVSLTTFDASRLAPRVVDLTEGLIGFCRPAAPQMPEEGADEATLAYELDWELVQRFAAGYAAKVTLSKGERAALPHLIRVRWLHSPQVSVRLRNLTEETDAFLGRLETALRWVDENEARLREVW